MNKFSYQTVVTNTGIMGDAGTADMAYLTF
jgi:hypothetical protein